jgi:saccharopine dehydrogenase-like NADP-dependent oxidoreductase
MNTLIIGNGRIGSTIHNLAQWDVIDSPSEEEMGKYDAYLNCTPEPSKYAYYAKRKPFFDISGGTDSKDAKKLYNRFGGVRFMGGLGLAPGLINIIAAYLVRECVNGCGSVDSIKLYCGGLPTYCPTFLKHQSTWSEESLVDNYTKPCQVISDGQVLTVEPLTDRELTMVDGVMFQAALTYGGLDDTLELASYLGTKECFYKTLRHIRHYGLVDDILSVKSGKKFLIDYLKSTQTDTDMVVVKVEVAKDYHKYTYEKIFPCQDGRTAMQLTTAIPAIASIHLLLNHKQDDWSYNTIADNYSEFVKICEEYGLSV